MNFPNNAGHARRYADEAQRRLSELESRLAESARQVDAAKARHLEAQRTADEMARWVWARVARVASRPRLCTEVCVTAMNRKQEWPAVVDTTCDINMHLPSWA